MKAWISYSLKDQKFAERLKKSLENSKLDLQFYDHSNLKAGVDWGEKIYKEIIESEIVLFIFSKDSVKSEWISTEIGIAVSELRKSDKKRIIPVVVDKNVELQNHIAPLSFDFLFFDL